MFKYLGEAVEKLFGGKKDEDKRNPKHRLTISIPSTKYDVPSKQQQQQQQTSTPISESTSPPALHKRSKSTKLPQSTTNNVKYKPKKKHQKTKSNHTLPKYKNGVIIDKSRPIFQQSDTFQMNSSLKFEITIQYQQQMWTVYKTLCDFVEFHDQLKSKYTSTKTTKSTNETDTEQNGERSIEVPPLLPLGLFYLYFQNAASLKAQKSKEYSPKLVYKQIYTYHQQQIMIQKRHEAQLLEQMKKIEHVRKMQHEQQMIAQQKQMEQLEQNTQRSQTPTIQSKNAENAEAVPFQFGTSNSLPLQNSDVANVSVSDLLSNHTKSVFDCESPFLKHMRVSLQIWLRVIVDDPMLMKCPELLQFIQFRWVFHKKNKNLIVGGVHSPDSSQYFDKSTKNKTNRNKSNDFNAMNHHNDEDNADRPTLSDFTLLKVVGKGAFGKVLQVRKVDDEGNVMYAMKILKKENVIKRNQIEHTKTERRVLGYVKHPFIVSLYYAFQTETKLFLVLDYCGGGELFFHLGKAGRFKEERARFYAASIALAIEYLHERDVIYRDLKPENVLLDSMGHIKLTDFGLSKENITETELAHSFCGTPEYLAPEILRRCGHGKPADWWSLGALLYEMLTGMPPFYSRDRDRLFEKILHSKLRFPNYFSDAAVNILTLLMQRNWKKRLGSYQSSNPSKYNNDPKKKSFAQLKGAQQIKRHVFFKSIDWNLLYERKLQPPFIPKLNDDQTNNFDAEFTEMPIYSMDNNSNKSSRYHREKRKYLLRFPSFTYVRNEELLKPMDDDSGDSEDDSSSADEITDESEGAGQADGDDDESKDSEQSDVEETNDKNNDGFEVFE